MFVASAMVRNMIDIHVVRITMLYTVKTRMDLRIHVCGQCDGAKHD